MNVPDLQHLAPAPGDALILVDVQNDFLPGGSLAVPAGDAIIAPLAWCAGLFYGRGLPVVATRDWHPSNHCSFAANGGQWPEHCVAGTHGAAFAPALPLPSAAHIVSKADTTAQDAYSGFAGTGLEDWLRTGGVRRVWVGGLATDYCVLNTVSDALRLGFAVMLISDAIRAVDVVPGDGERAIARMCADGASLVTSRELK